MSQHERNQFQPNIAPQEARRSFLMEYVRKIHQERADDFSWSPESRLYELDIKGRTVDDSDARLLILLEETENIRAASFIVGLAEGRLRDDYYEFDYKSPEPIRKMAWNGVEYEQVSQDDEVGQEEEANDIECILRNTDVTPPVTQLADERKFWQIATSLGVEVLEKKHPFLSRHFEQPDAVGQHQRKIMAYRAIVEAAYGHAKDCNPEMLRGALGEDIARYCMQRIPYNS